MFDLIIFLLVLLSILSSGNYIYIKLLSIFKINNDENFYLQLNNIFAVSLISNYFIIWIVGIFSINKIFFFSYIIFNLIFFSKNFCLFLFENIITKIKNIRKINLINKILIVFILFYFILLLLNSSAPPVDFDSLNYHLLIPKKYIEQGQILIDPSWGGFDFFPFLIEYFAIIFLLFNLENGLQFLNVFITLNIAFCIFAIGNLLKINTLQKLISVILFILIKNIVWLSSTSHNELLLCFFYILALLNLFKSQDNLDYLFFFSISCLGMLYTKYLSLPLGITFVPLLIYFYFKNKKQININKIIFYFSPIFLFLPFLLRNYVLIEDPLYPLFDLSSIKSYGYSDNLLAFLRSPLDIFFFGNIFFDGKQIGSPYLICFLALFYLFKNSYKYVNSITLVIVIYYSLWFFLLGKAVRFLVPIFPLVSILASIGITNYIKYLNNNILKNLLYFLIFIFFINQLIFLFAYSSVRVPSFFHENNKINYLKFGNKNYTINYAACDFINNKINENENYISLNFTSLFYCPINSSILGKYKNFLNENETIDKKKIENFININNVKYVLISKINSVGTSVGLKTTKRVFNSKQLIILDYLINKKIAYEDKLSKIYVVY